MLWKKYMKKYMKNYIGIGKIVSLTLCIAAFGSSMTMSLAEATNLGSLGEAVFGVATQYAQLNNSMNYFDNKGRSEYLGEMKKQYGVDNDEKKNAILHDVMTRLSASIEQNDPTIKEKPYNYFVNPSKDFNAFCSLGRNLSVNSGLFDLLNDNEDEIAFVVGHEMAHGENNHVKKSIQKSLPVNLVASVWGSQASATVGIGINLLAKQASAKMITKPQEWQADNVGFDYAVNAEYNPGAGAALWQRVIEKMGQNRSSFVGEIFSPSDHPTEPDRRDNYAKKLTAYSNNHVVVNDGKILVNNKEFMKVASLPTMSSQERAYLIGGRIAAVYHNNKVAPEAYVADNGNLYMGTQNICQPVVGDDSASVLADRLNKLK